jgi:uncharacterized protein (DUF1501 family)
MKSRSRRKFLRTIAAASAGIQFSPFSMLRQDPAREDPGIHFGNFKALVCINLNGGNDAHNMFIPTGANVATGYEAYAQARKGIAVANDVLPFPNLRNTPLGTGPGNPYFVDGTAHEAYRKGVYDFGALNLGWGVQGMMPELAQLIGDRRAALVSNMGPLMRPTTRSEIVAGSADLPIFMYAHTAQKLHVELSRADSSGGAGWVGQIADRWRGVNAASPFGMTFGYYWNEPMLEGERTQSMTLAPGRQTGFPGMSATGDAEDADRRAAFLALAGESSDGARVSFGAGRTDHPDHAFERLYGDLDRHALRVYDTLSTAWDGTQIQYQSRGSYNEELFTVPDPATLGIDLKLSGELIEQLESVAKMIHLAATGKLGPGFERQAFMVTLRGFDTHSHQPIKHAEVLRELSLAIWKFQLAMDELGHADDVLTFSMSEFGRALMTNGDGTDHGWGGHHFVLGGNDGVSAGRLRGGERIGELPVLTPGGQDDADDQGRSIPRIASEQLHASLAHWFGVPIHQLTDIFPYLDRFQTGAEIESALLRLFHP